MLWKWIFFTAKANFSARHVKNSLLQWKHAFPFSSPIFYISTIRILILSSLNLQESFTASFMNRLFLFLQFLCEGLHFLVFSWLRKSSQAGHLQFHLAEYASIPRWNYELQYPHWVVGVFLCSRSQIGDLWSEWCSWLEREWGEYRNRQTNFEHRNGDDIWAEWRKSGTRHKLSQHFISKLLNLSVQKVHLSLGIWHSIFLFSSLLVFESMIIGKNSSLSMYKSGRSTNF